MTWPCLRGKKQCFILFSNFCSNSNTYLILNCRENGYVANLYLKQQAKNKSHMPAAKGDLGRYTDKTKSCAWLGFCFRIKCKIENIVPTVKILQSTISEIKRHHVTILTFRSCAVAMNYDICSWLIQIFRTRVVRSGVQVHRCTSTRDPSCQQWALLSITGPFPSSPILPMPTKIKEFLFRYLLILFILISYQSQCLDFDLSGQICG